MRLLWKEKKIQRGLQHWLGVEPQPRVPRSGVESVVKHLPPIAVFRDCLPTVMASGLGLVLHESSVTRDMFHICHPPVSVARRAFQAFLVNFTLRCLSLCIVASAEGNPSF